ncbi:zinc finger protein GAI-ASSOCIATED FACTOR 1-like [Musa acuminata AAA Group]|uniref:zinc finger protein GAI-ASSOCIATED FACTOR 1-like n=1 Tax=Musa acuminata AAA Group TaxID=214697 RepID=UPI0031CFF9CC
MKVVEHKTPGLTSGTGEVTAVSSSQQSSFASPNPLPAKKKRGPAGNPAPEAEVVALSPKSLMATNRFVCEICNKGFQRDQNLQLHRRGHNLPWRLKQRTSKEARKKVYVCPEVSCVHHDPSRALGDLTGIKKHYSRKHGEKKWKCDKCSKKYAVQSDCKAHSKICGTREYKCDCGTLFSRRDSFITHRAFCDALAEENARVTTANLVGDAHQLLLPQPASSAHEHSVLPNTTNVTTTTTTTTSRCCHLEFSIKGEEQDPYPSMKPWQPAKIHGLPSICSAVLEPVFPYKNHQSPYLSSHPTLTSSPHLSATALLQKAAQAGATMSRTKINTEMAADTPTTAGIGLCLSSHRGMRYGCGSSSHGLGPSVTFLQATAPGGSSEGFLNGMLAGSDRLKGSHDKDEEFARESLCNSHFSSREILQMADTKPAMDFSSCERPQL